MPIHIDHLYKVLGKQEVLHDICLDIADGEVVGLLGPNGAGKSTLMKILLGLWEPTSGIVNAPTTHGYLPELNPLYDYMYVKEYLLLMDRLRLKDRCAERPLTLKDRCAEGARTKDKGQRIEEMMEKVGLMPVANKRIGELSKGYRQRVGIAQAMLGNPELLILDEPTTGLDPNQVVEIRKLIKTSPHQAFPRRGGCITILSTHRLEDVAEVCTRVIILDHGIVKYDSTEGIKTKDKGQKTLEDIFRQVTNYGK